MYTNTAHMHCDIQTIQSILIENVQYEIIMATSTAVNKIPKRYQLLASGLSKYYEKNLNLPVIPAIIQYLFILFYAESDEWMPNEFYLLSNNNKTIQHLKKKNKYSYIYGQLQMNGFQNENVIYQWSITIDRCINQSICIGLMNTECITTLKADKQMYYAYVSTAPFRMWYTDMQKADTKLLTTADMAQIKKILDQDVIQIKVKFTQGKETSIEFSNSGTVIMSYTGIKSQYKYQLYICMGSEDDQATITDFKTICYD